RDRDGPAAPAAGGERWAQSYTLRRRNCPNATSSRWALSECDLFSPGTVRTRPLLAGHSPEHHHSAGGEPRSRDEAEHADGGDCDGENRRRGGQPHLGGEESGTDGVHGHEHIGEDEVREI